MDLDTIISKKNLYPVFQPVVSLETGEVFGYEALTRTEPDVFSGPITQLFSAAEKKGRLWELDKLCRKTAIKTARAMGLKRRLFLNVSPESIYEHDFQEGFTRQQLAKYGIDPAELVLEITEHSERITDKTQSLKGAADYYRQQGYRIAVDDVGSAYSGLQRVCALNPDFIKIDMSIIHGIEKDQVRQAMVKSLVTFCASSGAGLVAEGIETAAELDELLSLDVMYGQGFFLAYPARTFTKATSESYVRIISFQHNKQVLSEPAIVNEKKKKKSDEIKKTTGRQTVTSERGHDVSVLAVPGITQFPDTSVIDVLHLFQLHSDCTLVTIVNTEKKVLGIMPRTILLDLFGSQYGYSLHSHKLIRELMITDFLIVDGDAPVEEVASRATSRAEENLYDPIIVEKDDCYIGIVTIKALLDSIVNVEVAARTQEISKKNRMLQEQQTIHDRDMRMAELVQKSFYCSKAPHTTCWDCAFLFKPMSSVSGDVYDFYYNGNGELTGTSLFDVSGHGVASGLIGILSKYLAEQVFTSYKNKPLEKMLRQFNTELTKEKGMVENYLTGIFLRITENRIEYVNAGHTDVLMKTPNRKNAVCVLGGNDDTFRGSFIGIEGLPDDYHTVTQELTGETYLLLYTDCFTESRNLAGDELGTDRLKEIFARTPAGSAKEVLAYLLDIFEAFTEAVPLRDDLTVIVMKYNNTRSAQNVVSY
jgi:EAL domain-containing protein (putative c-di-GMP-specific phosphodiesterase class I)/serine phosphatase RsbU (regulator of sigma subunit)/CBS domain-containing protein